MSRADYESRDLAGAARLARADAFPPERPSPDEYADDRTAWRIPPVSRREDFLHDVTPDDPAARAF